jgi:hypothetical protein|tara:strand:- start:693 stop:935 length:243 start_codon:yes stop_codon:yes gene_type:complete
MPDNKKTTKKAAAPKKAPAKKVTAAKEELKPKPKAETPKTLRALKDQYFAAIAANPTKKDSIRAKYKKERLALKKSLKKR